MLDPATVPARTWTRSNPAWCTMISATASVVHLGEETAVWETVRFEVPEPRRRYSRGRPWPRTSSPRPTTPISTCICLIAFELGLGQFIIRPETSISRPRHPEHNLARALRQFKLTESIEFLPRPPRFAPLSGPAILLEIFPALPYQRPLHDYRQPCRALIYWPSAMNGQLGNSSFRRRPTCRRDGRSAGAGMTSFPNWPVSS